MDANADGMHECQRIAFLGRSIAYGDRDTRHLADWVRGNALTFVQPGEPEITPEWLASVDVIIAEWLSRDYSAGEATLIRDWLEQGGGLFAMNGYWGLKESTNKLLAQTGLAVSALPPSGGPMEILPHAITRNIVGALPFDGGQTLTHDDGLSGGTNTVYATIGGDAVGIAQDRGAGRLGLFGEAWISLFLANEPEGNRRVLWRNIINWPGRFDG